MALTPEEKLKLNMLLAESEADLAEAAAIDKPTTAKELMDVFGTAVGQSASMNLLDELVAAGTDITPEERAAANKMIEAERNRTLGTAAAGLAGDIVGAVPAGIGAARIAGAKALRLLGLGAAEGAITGAGAGETPEERLFGAAIGTVLGTGAAAAGVAAPKVVRALSSEKQAAEAIEQLARETAEAQQQKLASIRGAKQLAKEAKPTRFKVEEEEPGEFIELVEPEMPTSGAKIANPLIGLDEPAEITPVSAKIKELQKEIGPSIYKDIEKPLVTPVVGPIVSEDVAPISNELLRQFAEDVARRGKKTRPQIPPNVPEPIYREAVKRVNELMSTLTPERRATFTEANINNQIRNTISSIMQEQAEAIAPRLDYIERFRGMSEGNIRKTIVEETKDLIESGRIYVTPEDKVKFIEDRVQKILSEVEEAPKGSVGAMRAKPKTESEKAGQTEMFSDIEMSGVLPEELAELGLQDIRSISDLDPSVFPGLIKSTKTLIAKKEKELKSKDLTKAQLDVIRDEIKQYKADIFEMENALKATRKQPETAAELAKDIAQLGFEQMKSGKPRGMVVLPFGGGKRKPKQLPEKTQSSQTTAMVPSLSKQEMQVAARGPSIRERLGKTGRSLQGALTVDEFRAERKMLEDELNFAQQKLDMASTDTEIRAAQRAQNAAFTKLYKFKQEYPDIDDLLMLVQDLEKREVGIAKRFNRGEHLLDNAGNTLTFDIQSITRDQVETAAKIRDVFTRYPELYDELPRSHPLIRAYEELPEPEISAFTESRGVMGRLEEMLGLKKR